MQIIQVKVAELIPAEYNPRKWDDSQLTKIKDSITKFGFVDPIIANKAKGRENILIGGHFRLHAAKSLGFVTVPVVYVDIPDLDEEQELNIRLNKNSGEWDWNLLGNIDDSILRMAGFEDFELAKGFNLDDFENKEVDMEGVDDKSSVNFTYPHSEYMRVIELLQEVREKLGLETKEEVLQKLLNDYV